MRRKHNVKCQDTTPGFRKTGLMAIFSFLALAIPALSFANGTGVELLTVYDILNGTIQFENILNKPAPTMKDMYLLFANEMVDMDEGSLLLPYATSKLHIDPNGPEWIKMVENYRKHPESVQSFYLAQLKYAIQGKSKGKIKLYLDPNFRRCTPKAFENGAKYADVFTNVNILSFVEGVNSLKILQLEISCSNLVKGHFQINQMTVDGKRLSEYPIFYNIETQ